jgi:hypothetical protein
MSITRSTHWVRILLIAIVMLAVPVASFGGHIGVSITIAPPVLLVYSQPVCPGEGYVWTPGYWAWGDDGYFWVPGTWVLAPEPGFLWTPGYWGWGEGVYLWHAGYWGPSVGFYGGINYGFGYFGAGYEGGYWHEGHFFYNREVNNVNVTVIHNTYNKTVINNTENRVSFNGGNGGTTARPTSVEVSAERQRRSGPTSDQVRQQREASTNRAQFASVNHGRPEVVATPKPGQFKGEGVVTARRSASTHATIGRTAESSRSTHANNGASSNRAAESSRTTHANNNSASNRAAESSRTTHANNSAASNRAAESSRTTHTNNSAADPSRSARSESKLVTSPTHENNVKSNSTPPRTESRPAAHAAKPPAQHESAPRPAVTQHAPRTEPKPTQHQAPPPAQHQSAQRPAMTQQAPRPEPRPTQHQAPPPAQHQAPPARSAQHQAAPPPQHGSAPRQEKKEPGR